MQSVPSRAGYAASQKYSTRLQEMQGRVLEMHRRYSRCCTGGCTGAGVTHGAARVLALLTVLHGGVARALHGCWRYSRCCTGGLHGGGLHGRCTGAGVTHGAEVAVRAGVAAEAAHEQHVLQTVPGAVGQLGQAEGLRLEAAEVCEAAQGGGGPGPVVAGPVVAGPVVSGPVVAGKLQQIQHLSGVEQVVAAEPGQAQRVEVAEGDGGEGEVGSRHPLAAAQVREVQISWMQHSQLTVPEPLCQWTINFLADRKQHVRLGKHISDPQTLSIGAPQGCVLSPLLYSLCTNDCTSTDSSVKLLKFADDTTLIGLIQDGEESAYRWEVTQLASWCLRNNLQLIALKTVELIVDFRNAPCLPPPPPPPKSPSTTLQSHLWI
ncbi:uncharacterized protein LOC144593031 [Rhinoraja longicauda]